jgi:hypothetical protein
MRDAPLHHLAAAQSGPCTLAVTLCRRVAHSSAPMRRQCSVPHDFYMIEAKPDNLIGDRAYDSDQLDAALRAQGTEMIAPHRSNRKRKT